MIYVKIQQDDGVICYQEIDAVGTVLRHLDEWGNFLYAEIPFGIGSHVIDAEPPRKGWML